MILLSELKPGLMRWFGDAENVVSRLVRSWVDENCLYCR